MEVCIGSQDVASRCIVAKSLEGTNRVRIGAYANRARYSIDKASNLLGYKPAVGFHEAIQRTAAWLRFARLLSHDPMKEDDWSDSPS